MLTEYFVKGEIVLCLAFSLFRIKFSLQINLKMTYSDWDTSIIMGDTILIAPA